jgi:hypothetical protein
MFTTSPKLNSIVAAQFTQDLSWYRAKIVDIDEKSKILKDFFCVKYNFLLKENTVFVYYVDFGNSEIVSITSLRHLEPDDLITHGQAIPCTLVHVNLK